MKIMMQNQKKISTSITVLISFLSAFTVFSQELITNIHNRKTTTLNGNWNYIVDPYETGYYNYRYKPYDQTDVKSKSAFYNNYHAKDKLELVEYDFDKSPTLLVPGDWNSQKENLLYYEGVLAP